jgi:hypothetical protein
MRIKNIELEYTKKVSDDIDRTLRQCGFRKLGENTNEGHAWHSLKVLNGLLFYYS